MLLPQLGQSAIKAQRIVIRHKQSFMRFKIQHTLLHICLFQFTHIWWITYQYIPNLPYCMLRLTHILLTETDIHSVPCGIAARHFKRGI